METKSFSWTAELIQLSDKDENIWSCKLYAYRLGIWIYIFIFAM